MESCLHYDLDFIDVGGKWPSSSDSTRLNNYNFAREQFELTPDSLMRSIVPDGLLRFADYDSFVHCTKLLGYPRLLTLKTVDMVIGQPPLITAQAKDKMTETIKDLRAASQLNSAFKQALIDYSRFGVLLLRVFKDKNGKAKITAWDPLEWTPVFYPDGTNRIHYNVIGWRYRQELTLQIHDTEDGSYEERICDVDSTGNIISIKSSKIYNKTSKKKLLFAVANTPTTTNPLGTSDYEIINGLLQKAIQRLQAILRVLDEHADPSMVGPYSLLSKDENGETVFKTNRYYAIGNDEKDLQYLVWEANLESSFKAFDELCKQIYILSEMGEAFLGAPEGSGNVVSGTAMRFKMISPLEKARRIQNDLSEPLKEIISSMLSIENIELETKDINITWRDSLPKDPREVAELSRLEAGSLSVKPLIRAIMDNYDLDRESAQKYVDEIYEDQKKQSELKMADNIDPATGEDGRSHGPTSSIDSRKKGSTKDPASSENRGDDQNAKLK
jgi:hypothetical protein